MRVWYWLKDKPNDEVTLTFLDGNGEKIKIYTSKEADDDDDSGDPRVPAEAGMNLFDWDMRYPGAHTVSGDKTTEGVGRGPLAPPGSYQVRLTVGEQSQTQTFEMVKDPRVGATQEDFDAQFALAIRVRDKIRRRTTTSTASAAHARRLPSGRSAPRERGHRKRYRMPPAG